MEAKAITKAIRISPTRARLVIDLIRGKNVSDALNILNNHNSKGARLITKTLNSAIANAVNNNGLDVDTLYVKHAVVNEGPTIKRMRAHAKGMSGRNDHRTSHIEIVVASKN